MSNKDIEAMSNSNFNKVLSLQNRVDWNTENCFWIMPKTIFRAQNLSPRATINITRPSISHFFFRLQYHSSSPRLNRFPKQITQTRQYPEWHCFPVVWLLFQLFNFGPNRHFLSLLPGLDYRFAIKANAIFCGFVAKLFMILFLVIESAPFKTFW